MAKPADNKVWKTIKPFLNGGTAGMFATSCIQPIDMVKVRIQLGMTGGPISVASQVIKAEGFGGLYKGLSAGLLRQATYTTARLGLFDVMKEELAKQNKGHATPLYQTMVAALIAGGMGALVGSPADLSLIRMQADGTLPMADRRNYKGVGDAMVRIVKEEGVGGLFTGAGPTAARAMALNLGMLATNEEAKKLLESLGSQKGSIVVTMGASAIAGFVASAFSLPFDFVKTRIQKMKANPDGTFPYKGMVDCAVKTFTQEGPLKFYTGFPTYYVRIAPHVMITLIAQDYLGRMQKEAGF